MSHVRVVVLLGSVLVSSCFGGGERLYPTGERPSVYNTLGAEARARVREARADWDAGERRVARAVLQLVANDAPQNLDVAVLLQELELELLAQGAELPDLELGDGEPLEELRRHYRDAAERDPTPARLVLAARIEPDVPAARTLLERASDLDPSCAWVDYGIAHLELVAEEFRRADTALARALESDPRLLRARRLKARMIARSETPDVAIRALEIWLEDAEESLWVRPRELAEARFDLLVLRAEKEQVTRVERLAADLLAEGLLDPAPIYLVLAAVRISDGEPAAALVAARNASRLAPASALPHVQRALILEEWQARPDKAWEAWLRALDTAAGLDPETGERRREPSRGERPDPAGTRDFQLWLLARTRLARLERRGIVLGSPDEPLEDEGP